MPAPSPSIVLGGTLLWGLLYPAWLDWPVISTERASAIIATNESLRDCILLILVVSQFLNLQPAVRTNWNCPEDDYRASSRNVGKFYQTVQLSAKNLYLFMQIATENDVTLTIIGAYVSFISCF